MSRPFIYDEKTSILYDPYGNFLKHVYCPQAKNWNQLINNDPSNKTRYCESCSGKVVNLDAIPPAESLALLEIDPDTCVYAGKKSPNVVYLRSDGCFSSSDEDTDYFYEASNLKNLKNLRISTYINEINQAVNVNYWPHITHSASISRKNNILRHFQDDAGCVYLMSDSGTLMDQDLRRIYSSESVATPYLQFSIAAYLIPPGTEEGERFFIRKPISIKKSSQGYEGWCAEATINNKQVVIDESTFRNQPIHIG